ncbi:MAG TPA: FKBP-type peptidyl-prolyl cis-trans isomerase [Fimbriimonas sp.]|nr:FKBP-type peptidyl-prolyl cis-trans isomerase [Fimbriimonas sp.]
MRLVGASLLIALLAMVGCNSTKGAAPSGLKELIIKDTVVGKGSEVANGDQVWVRYTGKLLDGSVFDGNAAGDKPLLPVTVGAGGVIPGWDKGLVGIREGGKRHLSIPNAMAYGPNSQGKVPAYADLYFDIEAVRVFKRDDIGQVSIEDVKPGSGRALKTGDTVTIDYVATDLDGKELLSSKQEGAVTFKVGNHELDVNGLEAGIMNPNPMRVGGRRKVILPPPLGMPSLGAAPGAGPSIQTFDVTVKSVK